MAGKKQDKSYGIDYAFYQQLWQFYSLNRGKIRSRYNRLTKKFLDYNDRTENHQAYLRTPQFEALEMYVFLKEFMGNAQVYEIFDEWRRRTGHFEEASYYAVEAKGQLNFFATASEELMDYAFTKMKEVHESYPNYIYALTMGLGKTTLMATCIFYEFLLANKDPKNPLYCHNALVFAPDKTVLNSQEEIRTLDKSLVVPKEYVPLLDTHICFHYLDDGNATLQIQDGSNFNIIISNTQKIILKKRHTEANEAERLFDEPNIKIPGIDLYDDDEEIDEDNLIYNQRFRKICRLPQLGVYVDEAHHLFGTDLLKEQTSLRATINAIAKKTKSLVACYNYTGTPYVQNHLLPEVVYAYGLADSIAHNYLKEARPLGYDNVKGEDFIREVITQFWEQYGGKTYDGLNPKIALYASTIDEAVNQLRPLVEKVIADLGLSADSILVNVGDEKYTKEADWRMFRYELDKVGSEGNRKQFLILVEKGKEGWNCKSLFSVVLYRKPKSTIFVLQATMRCLRAITEIQQKATIFLSKENYDILNDELNKNFNVDVSSLENAAAKKRKHVFVKVLPPPRVITLKQVFHKHTLEPIEYSGPVTFGLAELDLEKYKSYKYSKISLSSAGEAKVEDVSYIQSNRHFSAYMLTAEVGNYLHQLPCSHIHRVLVEATDGLDVILEKVNQFNDILYDVVIPRIFQAFFRVKTELVTKDMKITLLKPPHEHEYYEFSANEDMLVTIQTPWAHAHIAKSFHADTYCFDSKPEYECFRQYLFSEKVKHVYFTGMFTSQNQSDLAIPYVDPESQCLRHYYPDFLVEMEDGSYQLIEIKGDNMIDNATVQAKSKAAEEIAVASKMHYRMICGSTVMHSNVLEEKNTAELL